MLKYVRQTISTQHFLQFVMRECHGNLTVAAAAVVVAVE